MLLEVPTSPSLAIGDPQTQSEKLGPHRASRAQRENVREQPQRKFGELRSRLDSGSLISPEPIGLVANVIFSADCFNAVLFPFFDYRQLFFSLNRGPRFDMSKPEKARS